MSGDFVLIEKEYGLEIVARDEENVVKKLNDFDPSKNSLLFDFLATDISSHESILKFYRKYGLLGNSYKDNGESRIEIFSKQVICCRSLLGLYNACAEKKIYDVVRLLCIFIYLFYDNSALPSGLLDAMQPLLMSFPKSHVHKVDKSYLRITLPRYVHSDSYRDASKFPTIFYDYSTDCLKTAFSFNKYIGRLTDCQKDDIIACSMEVCAYILSDILKGVHVEVLFCAGRLTNCWVAPDLRSLIFYELSQRIIEGDIIRRCSCKTCREYFQIYGNDTRKIYCSTHCAQLEAKRKQRIRQKRAREGVVDGEY